MAEMVVRSARGARILPLLNPWSALRNLWRHRQLTLELAKRDIQGRYRAAHLGLIWSLVTPLVLLATYTFVFAVVFKARWGSDPHESRAMFALVAFCGVLVFTVFSEVVGKAPTLIVGNPNYVKKVVFPLEVFVPSAVLSALFNLLVGLFVWMAGRLFLVGLPPWTIIWLPAVLLPVCLLAMGVSWFLASVGVFVRDVGHAVALILQVLFFGTPIFYRLDSVGQPFRRVLELNPLTHAVEDARGVLMYSRPPEWGAWLWSFVVTASLAVLGYAFFMKSKRAFADVL